MGAAPDSCDSCLVTAEEQNECPSQAKACSASGDCVAFVKCVAACAPGDANCSQSCQMTDAAGYATYEAYMECLACETCGAECASDWSTLCGS
jgi:hypothetical protein